MPELPWVSVVVPSFNRAHYMKRTLDSILGQDYPNIECLVMDGGSKDGTVEILKSYGNRIKWVSEPDKGQSDAINKGWRMSRGEILTWLNADDIWQIPSAVSDAVSYLQAHPKVVVVYGKCGNIDAEGRPNGMAYVHDWNLDYAVEFCDHCIAQPASFIRRSALESVNWVDPNLRIKMDHDLWLRLALVGEIHHIPKVLAHACSEKGITFEGRGAAASCVEVTRKFFSLPAVPAPLRIKKQRAMSNAYLRGIEYAWAGGRHLELMALYGWKAFQADPSNAGRIFSGFARFLSLPFRRRCA
ncbi:MAG: glycosyltransferase [Candidatus Omnitrophica bacterium]|nr:glycosyltransferase [Candidatus Omnitrophota bacterium]